MHDCKGLRASVRLVQPQVSNRLALRARLPSNCRAWRLSEQCSDFQVGDLRNGELDDAARLAKRDVVFSAQELDAGDLAAPRDFDPHRLLADRIELPEPTAMHVG